MPALSPTMEAGVIAAWKVAEGDAFVAGDAIAEIETDKATMDFEAQDDGVVAKILVAANQGDVVVNAPILVVVEDASDVAAFHDYVVAEEDKAAPVVAVEEIPVVAAAPTPVVAAAPAPVAAVAPTPPPPPVVVAPTPEAAPALVGTMAPAWGNGAKTNSPLAKMTSAAQKQYIAQYGSTGQVPL